MSNLDSSEIERWITVRGTHVPIKKGQSQSDAINAFMASKGGSTGKYKNANAKGISDEELERIASESLAQVENKQLKELDKNMQELSDKGKDVSYFIGNENTEGDIANALTDTYAELSDEDEEPQFVDHVDTTSNLMEAMEQNNYDKRDTNRLATSLDDPWVDPEDFADNPENQAIDKYMKERETLGVEKAKENLDAFEAKRMSVDEQIDMVNSAVDKEGLDDDLDIMNRYAKEYTEKTGEPAFTDNGETPKFYEYVAEQLKAKYASKNPVNPAYGEIVASENEGDKKYNRHTVQYKGKNDKRTVAVSRTGAPSGDVFNTKIDDAWGEHEDLTNSVFNPENKLDNDTSADIRKDMTSKNPVNPVKGEVSSSDNWYSDTQHMTTYMSKNGDREVLTFTPTDSGEVYTKSTKFPENGGKIKVTEDRFNPEHIMSYDTSADIVKDAGHLSFKNSRK